MRFTLLSSLLVCSFGFSVAGLAEDISVEAFGLGAGQQMAEESCAITAIDTEDMPENLDIQGRISWRANQKNKHDIERTLMPTKVAGADYIANQADEACFKAILVSRKMSKEQIQKLDDKVYQKCVDLAVKTYKSEMKNRGKSPATCPGISAYWGYQGAFPKASAIASSGKYKKTGMMPPADVARLASEWCASSQMDGSSQMRRYFNPEMIRAFRQSKEFVAQCRKEYSFVLEERLRGKNIMVGEPADKKTVAGDPSAEPKSQVK